MEKEENNNEKNIKDKASKIINDVKDDSNSFDKKDVENGKGMGILSYLGFLCLIPYLTEKNNKFVIYHAKQGLNLFICEVITALVISIISTILWRVGSLLSDILGLVAFLLSVLGIVNVINGKAKELPIINKFKIIK